MDIYYDELIARLNWHFDYFYDRAKDKNFLKDDIYLFCYELGRSVQSDIVLFKATNESLANLLIDCLTEESKKGNAKATTILEKIADIPYVFPFGEECVFTKENLRICEQFFFCGYDKTTIEEIMSNLELDESLRDWDLYWSLIDENNQEESDSLINNSQNECQSNNTEESVMNTLIYGNPESLGY